MSQTEIEALRNLIHGRVLLLCHKNADPDTICSAYAFERLVEPLYKQSSPKILLTGGASRVSKRVMKKIGIETVEEASIQEADVLVFFDIATLSQLDKWGQYVAGAQTPKIFIDHHSPSEEVERLSTIYIVDEESTSTCEIIYDIYKGLGVTPSHEAARAMLVGMAYDSKHFKMGDAKTFKTVSDLLGFGLSLEDELSILDGERDKPERIARLKAAQRMKIMNISRWVVATTHISSFQGSGARALLELGADLALVAGGRRGLIKASIRSTRDFFEETRIHLGRDIAKRLGEEFSGDGSGHSTSAGVNCSGDVRLFLDRANATIKEKIEGLE
ncbi:MAG: DHH family phosphoesterase [Candidatus Bathyarchaeia archaeon]